jgi:quercetin dioxygenase-like cupin family protein
MNPPDKKTYPDFIKNLPQADLPLPDAVGHLLSGSQAQVVFFELPAGMTFPPHSHNAQWGVVVSGKLELNIGGDNRLRQPGDSYFVPDQVEHSAKILEDSLVLEVFADPNRYQEKG